MMASAKALKVTCSSRLQQDVAAASQPGGGTCPKTAHGLENLTHLHACLGCIRKARTGLDSYKALQHRARALSAAEGVQCCSKALFRLDAADGGYPRAAWLGAGNVTVVGARCSKGEHGGLH